MAFSTKSDTVHYMVLSNSVDTTKLKLEKITQFANQIIQGSTLSRSCEFLFDTFQDVIPFESIGLSLIDKSTDKIVLKWSKSKNNKIDPNLQYSGPIGKGLRKIMLEGKPQILNDLMLHLKENPGSEVTKKITSYGMRSSLTCPIKTKDECFGFLFFSSESKDVYKAEHIESYQLIANQIAFLMEKIEQEENISSLKMKERFFYKCLHDMGNSLNIVSCYSKLTLNGKYEDVSPKILRVLQGMDKQIDNTLRLFAELQNFGDVISPHFNVQKSNVDLNSFLSHFQQASEFLTAKKKINFAMTLDPDLPEVFYMDPKRISQVLENLVSNAIKYSLADTTIRVKVTALSEGGIMFGVKDEGRGMSRTDMDRIFDKSNSASLKNFDEAIGLRKGIGLAICKRIIDDHEGEFWVESNYGMGSLFAFSLPNSAIGAHSKELANSAAN